MRDKTVILCEGVHDLIFFSILLDQNGFNYKMIRNHELTETRERTPETNAIMHFLSRKGKGIRFLLKDEDGCTKCIDNFTILYEDKDDRYQIFLCLDGDQNNLSRLRRSIQERLRKDILVRVSDHAFHTKDPMKHHVFFIPDSLERQVQSIAGINLDAQSSDEKKREVLNRLYRKVPEQRDTMVH
jgi:hypothetical protein